MKHLGSMTIGLMVLMTMGVAMATPANNGVCDELVDATPGLYGLCVAFCEAHECEADFTAGDPWADCKPSDPKLLEIYDKLKDPGDPEMPCIIADSSCPCFTQAMVDAIPTPYSQCIIDYCFGCPDQSNNDPATDELTTNILFVQGTGVQATLSPF